MVPSTAMVPSALKGGPISRLFLQRSGQLLRGEKMEISGWMCLELGFTSSSLQLMCNRQLGGRYPDVPCKGWWYQWTPSKGTASYFKAQVDVTGVLL